MKTIVAFALRLHGTAEIRNSGSNPGFGPPRYLGHILMLLGRIEVRA